MYFSTITFEFVMINKFTNKWLFFHGNKIVFLLTNLRDCVYIMFYLGFNGVLFISKSIGKFKIQSGSRQFNIPSEYDSFQLGIVILVNWHVYMR